jgi:hypothetical protein
MFWLRRNQPIPLRCREAGAVHSIISGHPGRRRSGGGADLSRHLVFEFHNGRALGADSEEKHESASDLDTVAVDSLKALDPNRPIRKATKVQHQSGAVEPVLGGGIRPPARPAF